jgi:Transcription factor WhiB
VFGHIYMDGSWKVDHRGYRQCLVCVVGRTPKEPTERERALARARQARHKERQRFHVRLVERSDEGYEDFVVAQWERQQNAATAPWNVNIPKAQDELNVFLSALDSGRTKCFGDPRFTDYDDSRYPEETTGVPAPTSAEAEAMCAGCPFFAECDQWSLREKPAWGVYAGRVWRDGKVLT